MAKEACKNCGEPTVLSSGDIDRVSLGWCVPCFRVKKRRLRQGNTGVRWFKGVRYYVETETGIEMGMVP